MKILHTSDWHLGHLLYQQKRDEEHRAFLDWLLDLIGSERVDLLLVAGDVFDTGCPSNYALEMYFSFLARCGSLGCRQVVVVGGNHDSPATLQAPRQILQALRVTVIGAVDPARPEACLLTADDEAGRPEALICAIPYLRDRDVHTPLPGETYETRSQAIIDGTATWYRRLADLACARRQDLGNPDLPIIATGHLFAQGMTRSGGERDLYVGDLGAFPVDRFPKEFAYLALGHLHRPQAAAGTAHVRYSGSPIPLSFDEIGYPKEVTLVDTHPPISPRSVNVPCFRPIAKIVGTLDQIGWALRKIPSSSLVPWAEVIYDGQALIPRLKDRVDELTEGLPVQVLACRDLSPAHLREHQATVIDIHQITPEEVFAHRLAAGEFTDDDRTILEGAFREILFRVRQGDQP